MSGVCEQVSFVVYVAPPIMTSGRHLFAQTSFVGFASFHEPASYIENNSSDSVSAR